MLRFDTFDAAYLHGLRWIYESPQFRVAPRGFASRENLGFCFELTDPLARVSCAPERKTNIIFNFAEALWYLSGQADLEQISYYAPSIRKYSMDGRTLTGTAYGAKLFRFGGAAINQWNRAVDLLKEDPNTKRAVLQIFDAHELLIQDNIDVSCTLGLQFFVREGRLYAAAYMRANDAFRGVVSDIFSFTFLQEMMARQLGLKVGSYFHYVGSFHIYEPDIAAVERLLSAAPPAADASRERPAMPEGDNWESVRSVLYFEQELRHGRHQFTRDSLAQTGLPSYWQQVLALFEVYRQIRQEGHLDAGFLDCLLPFYQRLVLNRWGSLLSSKGEKS
ncbi:thymidylate synthase [Stigmatella aurantiaca]|nr:thymidylate synthase [Stigmatella aurantiaca]EAU64710.1 thymidylate synthase [Stigmatella aurantiaca DW4/3-1]